MAERIYSHQNKTFFYGLFIIVSILTYLIVKPYLSLVILAFLTATLFRPIYLKLFRSFKDKSTPAIFLTMIIIILSFVLPVLFVSKLTFDQINEFNDDIQPILTSNLDDKDEIILKANEAIDKIPFVNYELTDEKIEKFGQDVLKPVGNFIVGKAINWGSSALGIVTSLIVFLTLLGSFLSVQPRLIEFLKRFSPLDDDIDSVFINKLISMATSMVRGTFVIAIIQGLISGLLLLVLGVDYAFFFGLMSAFVSIIPLGSGVINIPLGLVLILAGNPVTGLVIILFNILVTGNIDNFLRPRLVSKDAKLPHPLVLLGVLGGIKFFGFFGFIYGPAIMILFITTVETYIKYYRKV